MNSYERIKRMYEHREADRVPIMDDAWKGTVRRWRNEGMPANVEWWDYFDIDRPIKLNVDISPRLPKKILEENDRYVISTTSWGVTLKSFKEEDSTPEFLDFSIRTEEAWEKTKALMTLDDDRIGWKRLQNYYNKWRADGKWVIANFYFGFSPVMCDMMGTEDTLIALIEQPELVTDTFDTLLGHCEQLFQRVWDAGYRFDEVFFADDLGYKNTTFFSPSMYRELLQPYQARAVKWAHDRGIVARMHSCGDVHTLLPDIVATGVDALNPLEVKAGMDPIQVKKEWGDKLTLHGGFNAMLWKDTDKIIAEIDQKLPILKENGGYLFASDHSIPNDVSLETMKRIVAEVKNVGRY